MGTLELSNLIQLEINENLRNISIPKKGVVFGVDGDIEVNRVAFVFPRYYSNFDMTEFSARVNYVNANGEANYYEADDMSSDDGDTATFSWLMTSDVTSYIGEVRFSVLLYKRLDERYVKKFGTRPATGRVLEGLDVESYVTPEQQLTLIEKMEKKFDAYVEAKMLSVNHDIEDAKNGALDAIEEAKNDVDSFITSSKSEIDTLRSSSLDDIKNLTDTSKLNISTLTDEKLTSLDKETVRQLKNIELAGVEETEKIRTAFSSAVSDIQAEGQKQADAVDSHGDSKIKEINDSTATSLANINSISEKQVEAIRLEGTKQMSSVSSEGNKQVSTVTSAGATEVTKVKKASSTALSDIGSAKESSISEITAKGTEQVKTIKDTSTSEISKVQAAGTSQVKSVSDEGKIQIDGVKSEGEKQVQSVSAKGTQSLQDIDTAKTAAVKSVNDQTKPIIDKVEQLKQNVNDKSDSVDEAYEQMKKLHCIEISKEAPTNERTGLWVNPKSNEEINIPEIKDEEVSDIDTWSSQKINHEIDSLKEDIDNIIYKGLINGFNKDNTVGGYLSNDGNVKSDSRFVTSDYFDVHENKTYYALQMVNAVKYDTVSYICFYDSSKTFIAGGYFCASSCTSPNGSKYARVTFSSGEDVKARCMFTSIETPVKYYPFGYEYSVITKDVSELKTRKIENRLYGKTMAILGDSMAKGHTLNEKQTWAYKIANRNGMVYQKLAINGTFITTGHGDADANCLLEQAKKINNNPDIIVIHMGTNDRNKNVELGRWTIGNTDTTNLFGALRVAFTYLAENFPLAQVMFITPYYYQELTDYIGSIEKACMFVGWHCKNNKQGGIWAWNTNVKNALFLDDVHLNEVGQERASYEYEGFMRTFM